jgi:DNA modification methylase
MNLFMADGRLLFTWNVIERELRKMEELDGTTLEVWRKDEVTTWKPDHFQIERSTVWNFPKRGDWAVHQSDYRGNWPPQLARNLILGYTRQNDLVVDLFAGGGTTLIEAWLTGRNGIGLDISDFAIKTTVSRLAEMDAHLNAQPEIKVAHSVRPLIVQADSRRCGEVLASQGIAKEHVALFCAHPPYLNALHYTNANQNDLSRLSNVDEFCSAIRTIASEARPWLKRTGTFALLIGDVRKNSQFVPLGFRLLQEFLLAGYFLKEIIIKTQNNDSSNNLWAKHAGLKHLIAHEYLLLFTKTR